MKVIIDNFFKPFSREINYTLDVLIKEYLKLPPDFEILIYYGKNNLESNIQETCAIQFIPSNFFNKNNYLTHESLPREPITWVNVSDLKVAGKNLFDSKIPILFTENGNPTQLVEFKKNYIVVHIDLIASVFFMLTRYEEKIVDERDSYKRFPAERSLSFKEGFYHRPIVNEYIELLWDWLRRLFPTLRKSDRKFTIRLTHDIDQFRKYESLLREVIRVPYEIGVHRGKFLPAFKRFGEGRKVFAGAKEDPCNTFEQLMDISEENGVRSIFYFMADESKARYKISDPKVHETINKILARGHEIGLHPTFGTFDSYEKLTIQKKCLDKILGYTNYGARQHFLQWKATDTWRIYEKAGLSHDSSLGHVEMPGFRCGTCYPYSVFDFEKRQKLSLTERPLIVMDASVYSIKYETLRRQYFEKAFGMTSRPWNIIDYVFLLKRQIQKINGCFSMLWHNDRFEKSPVSDYIKLIKHFSSNTNDCAKL